MPLGVIVIGAAGFMILEKLSLVDALYFAVVTLSTVGYGDITPSTEASKIFSVFLIVVGIGTFLTIISTITQTLMQRGQKELRSRNLSMIIGVFFTEVGNELLSMFTGFDPNIRSVRDDCRINQDCSETDLDSLKHKLESYEYTVDPGLLDPGKLAEFLKRKGDLLLRQIENPTLIEHESFSQLLWAIIHLRDELVSEKGLAALSGAAREHLANDAKRAYTSLAHQWLGYLQHLQKHYPFLFSLAIRTNPLSNEPDSAKS